ncbi:xylan 1,4-beta-xylosidase, partial [Sphingomonas sanguinis]
NGWPIILDKGKTVPWTLAKPRLPASPAPKLPTSGDFDYTDEFDGTRLAMQWIGVRTPKTPFYTVANGSLTMRGGDALGDRQGVPGFVGRRQQHAIADVSTTLTFTPAKDGARAGLVAMQNDYAYLFFGLTRIDGQTRIALYKREGKNTRDETAPETLVASAPLNAKGPVTLSLRAKGGTMAFDYRVGGKT